MYIESAVIGVVVGALGTIAGGLLALLIGKHVKEPRPFLAFAGGMMVAVVFFDILIESTQLSGIPVMLVGAAAGGIFFAVAAPLFSHDDSPTMYQMGIFVLVGIALHNLPEGLAIGSALMENQSMAFSLALLMLVHDVPEGVAVCLPLRLSGMPVRRVFVYAFITAIPTALGSVLGTAVGAISREMIAGCMAFAGGAMLFISLRELIPAAGKQKALPALLGLAVGFLMTTIV